MSFRSRALEIVEVLLRVPPLFVIDEILKSGVGFSEYEVLVDNDLTIFDETQATESVFNNVTTSFSVDPVFCKYMVFFVLRLALNSFGCAAAVCLFVLNIKHLMVVYMYLMSVGLIFISYWTNSSTIKHIISRKDRDPDVLGMHDILMLIMGKFWDGQEWSFRLLQNYIFQLLIACIFINIHLGPRHTIIQAIMVVSFATPTFMALIKIPTYILSHTPLFSALLPLVLVKFILWSSFVSVSQSIYAGYIQAKNFVSNFGVSALVENEWVRLNVPEVLRTFWMLRTLEHAVIFFMSGYWSIDDGMSPYFRLVKYLLVTGCDTLTAVLGITSIVSYICNYIGKLFQWILLSDDENDKNFGTVSAVVFYILALQTGLTGLEPDVRFIRLCKNFCLLFTALLHFTHNVVNPLLMSLSASHNPSVRRHIHALIVCAVLVISPSILMYFLWKTQETSTWLLAVTVFSIEVIVKVFVSLAIYSLFLLDARRETFWEKLDDYIYYIRAFGNTVEFCFGIFLFFNGAWILLFESGSAIRAVMVCIHAYFNIWCDAKAGWSVFMKRRTAVNKIESLPEADKEQLRILDDVCAICYQEMQNAKITRCKHFFHGVCLRKWLYVQDKCPLCHEILHAIDTEERNGNIEANEPQPEVPDLPFIGENNDDR